MNSRKLKLYSGLSALLLLVGCAGTTEIVEISPNVYSLSGYSDITDNAGSVRINLIKKPRPSALQRDNVCTRLNPLRQTEIPTRVQLPPSTFIANPHPISTQPLPIYPQASSEVAFTRLFPLVECT